MSTAPPDQTPAPATAAAQWPGCLATLLFAGTGLGIMGGSALLHAAAWGLDQVLLISGRPLPGFAWTLISWAHGLLLALPVVPLAFFVRAPRFRAAYQAWALAIGYIAVLGLARVFPATDTQPAALAQILLSITAMIGLMILNYWRSRARGAAPTRGLAVTRPRLGGLLTPLGLAAILILPFLLWGALGSPLDTALNALAGLSLGLFTGVLLDFFLARSLAAHTTGPDRDIALAAFTATVTLAILGSGFGFGGSQLLLLIALPPLGLAIAGLAPLTNPPGGSAYQERGVGWPQYGEGGEAGWGVRIAGLVGVVAAAALALVDPDEMALILGGNEILTWALRAAGLTFLLALIVGAVLWLLNRWARSRPTSRPRAQWVALGGFILAWLIAWVVYLAFGQPGFYGERMFVVLNDQADVSAAYDITDRNDRLSYVYTTLTDHAATTQAGLRAVLDQIGAGYQPYYLVNGIEVNGGPLLRAYLSFRPDVDRVIDSPHLRPLPEPLPVSEGDESAPVEPPWNITAIGADRVWEEFGATGEGIVVGQSDSGVQGDHPALREGYRGQTSGDDYNWLDPWNHSPSPIDIGGHGTHTLGSAVGRGGIGVAPGAQWFACVNLARNLANPPFYIDCMQFMLAPYPQGGDPLTEGDPSRAAHVINNSWGCPPLEGCDAESLGPAVSALRAAGIFVVASAGNEGPFCGSVSDPIATYDDAFSVGAVDAGGDVAIFSSRGPVTVDGSERIKPDLLAPGVAVLSSLPQSTYGENSGTSMAGPHVAGAVALLWSAQPTLIGDIDRTELILIETAQRYTAPVDDCGDSPENVVGHGILDVYAAVKRALESP